MTTVDLTGKALDLTPTQEAEMKLQNLINTWLDLEKTYMAAPGDFANIKINHKFTGGATAGVTYALMKLETAVGALKLRFMARDIAGVIRENREAATAELETV